MHAKPGSAVAASKRNFSQSDCGAYSSLPPRGIAVRRAELRQLSDQRLHLRSLHTRVWPADEWGVPLRECMSWDGVAAPLHAAANHANLAATAQCTDTKPASGYKNWETAGSWVKYADAPGVRPGNCKCLECKNGFALVGETCRVRTDVHTW